MAGMLRFKDEKDFQALLRVSHLRIHDSKGVKLVAPPRPKPKSAPTGKIESDIEALLASQITLVGNLPTPERNYPYIRGRKYDLDFAWPEWTVNGMQIGLEVQGMAHRIKSKFSADLEKRAIGLLQGWVVLEVGGDQIRSGRAMEWLQELFSRAIRKAP
jgi:hypothetical protein